MEKVGLCRISKEENVKEKDRLGHFHFILIKSLCTLNTHTYNMEREIVSQENNPDTLSKVLVEKYKLFQSFKNM